MERFYLKKIYQLLEETEQSNSIQTLKENFAKITMESKPICQSLEFMYYEDFNNNWDYLIE